jgi:hypothetical protein
MNDQQPATGSAAPDWAVLAGAPATAESLVALAGADPAVMTGAVLVDAIVASEKALSLLAGTQMRMLAALAVPFVAGDPMRLAAVLAGRVASPAMTTPPRSHSSFPQRRRAWRRRRSRRRCGSRPGPRASGWRTPTR